MSVDELCRNLMGKIHGTAYIDREYDRAVYVINDLYAYAKAVNGGDIRVVYQRLNPGEYLVKDAYFAPKEATQDVHRGV